VPAFGPSPAASTISAAQTNSGIARSALSSRRDAACASRPKRPAAGSASNKPNRAASNVPMADIASVSSVPRAIACICAGDRSGAMNPEA